LLTGICTKSFVGWDFAPDPTGGAYSAPQTHLGDILLERRGGDRREGERKRRGGRGRREERRGGEGVCPLPRKKKEKSAPMDPVIRCVY